MATKNAYGAKTPGFFRTIERGFRIAFKEAYWLTTGIAISAVIAAILPFVQAKAYQYMVDAIVLSATNKTVATTAAIFAVIIWASAEATENVLISFRTYMRARWQYIMNGALDMMAISKSAEIDIATHENSDFQSFRQRALNKGPFAVNEVPRQVLDATADIAAVFIASYIFISFSWKLFLILLVTQLPIFALDITLGKRKWGVWYNRSEDRKFYNHYRNHLTDKVGIIQTKLFQNTTKLLKMVRDVITKTENEFIAEEKRRVILGTFAEICSSIGFAIVVWLITKSALLGIITVGSLTFLISSMTKLSGSMSRTLSMFASLYESTLYSREILAYFDTPPFLKVPNPPKRLNLHGAPEIVFENVSFGYPDQEKDVISNLSITIKPGEHVAIVGANGAGKSTLLRLFCRFFDPTKGKVLVNGVSLRDVEPEEWQKSLSVLTQDFATYHFKVDHSIAFSDTKLGVDNQKVAAAATKSTASGFIEDLPGKMEAQLGTEFAGVEPSKGQKQKLAIARSLYRERPVLILDEPTAAVDADSRVAITDNLEHLSREQTVICISHDFAAVRRFDRILFFKDGKLIEDGTHAKLISIKGEYARQFEDQVGALTGKLQELEEVRNI
jgi:ABC-type multidrug transport system fused ATPase/permease subunit